MLYTGTDNLLNTLFTLPSHFCNRVDAVTFIKCNKYFEPYSNGVSFNIKRLDKRWPLLNLQFFFIRENFKVHIIIKLQNSMMASYICV